MGCRKITYGQGKEATPFLGVWKRGSLAKKESELKNRDSYYPFGLSINALSSTAPLSKPNNYKFNGIEQNTDFDLNTYDAFFREYDPALGRWWQIDPKLSERESPYVGMGNNPIFYNDYLGDTVKGSAAGMQLYQNLVNSTDNEIARLDKRIAKRAAKGKDTSGQEKRRARYQGVKDELAELESSTQVYNITTTDAFNDGDTPVAATLFNARNNEVDLFIPTNGDSKALLAHELKHASQFERGTLSLPLHNNKRSITPLGWLAYDLQDEIAGDNRADLFGSKTKSSTTASHTNLTIGGQRLVDRNIQYTVGSLTYYQTIERLQSFADKARQALRLNGRTYRPSN